MASIWKKQKDLSDWLGKLLQLDFPSDQRSIMVLSCCHLTFEHHAAIYLLCKEELYGSMFALYRVIFESTIRGLYISYCASEEELDCFKRKDGFDIHFGSMIDAIEMKLDSTDGPLSTLKKESYKLMNSFTHTGYEQLIRRNENQITGGMSYPIEEIEGILNSSGTLSLFCAAVLVELKGDENLFNNYMNRIREYAQNNI